MNCQVLPQKDGLDSLLQISSYKLDLLDSISSKNYTHAIQSSDSDRIFHKPVEENLFFFFLSEHKKKLWLFVESFHR